MTVAETLSGAEMTPMCFIFLLLSESASVFAQFNGYNCDANHHSRFPGEKMQSLYASTCREYVKMYADLTPFPFRPQSRLADEAYVSRVQTDEVNLRKRL